MVARDHAMLLLASLVGLSAVCGSAAAQSSPWNEQPADIVVARDVPRQNAILVGEPGRPTRVNPRSIVLETMAFAGGVGGVVAQTLSDGQADDVRATARPGHSTADSGALVAGDLGGAGSSSGGGFAGERASLIGGAVSGAVGGATRQMPGLIASALDRGRP